MCINLKIGVAIVEKLFSSVRLSTFLLGALWNLGSAASNSEVADGDSEFGIEKLEFRSQAGNDSQTVDYYHRLSEQSEDILENIHSTLKRKYGDTPAFSLSHDNHLPKNWIQQTPNIWGDLNYQVPKAAGKHVATTAEKMILRAEHWVDITTLYPYPDGQFLNAVTSGLRHIAASGRDVHVRILAGWNIQPTTDTQEKYLKTLVSAIGDIHGSRLKISVAAQRTNPGSWNHAKIIAVDGKEILVGGENFWDLDYLGPTPVHDLNIRIQGGYASDAQMFINTLWQDVCAYKTPSWKPVVWNAQTKKIEKGCFGVEPGPANRKNPDVTVLGLGRYGPLKKSVNPADTALLLAMESAESAIRIAQQDLGWGKFKFWTPGMEALAKALLRGVDVYVVLSSDNGKAGNNSYSIGTLSETAHAIESYVKNQKNSPKGEMLENLLCDRLHLATIRFGKSTKWQNGYEFANHAKFLMVDDKVFYVGSENLYPSDLIEYGAMLSDKVAIADIYDQYWGPLWNYSSVTAISGKGTGECIFSD